MTPDPFYTWPLVVVIEDCYKPAFVADVLKRADVLGDEMLRRLITIIAIRNSEWIPCQLN